MNADRQTPTTHAADPATATAEAGRWVPIRLLNEHHRPRVLRHLLALSARDRYLRFGYAAGDHHVERYVAQLDFSGDELFGIFDRRLELLAVAHLAYLAQPGQPALEAEFGVSVDAGARGLGWGRRLFTLCSVHARNRGVDTLLVHALSENTAMLRIARGAGARVAFDGPDAVARVQLQPQDLASHVEAIVEQQVAEFDYGLKRHAQRLDGWLRVIGNFGAPERDSAFAPLPSAPRRGAPPTAV